MASIWEDLDRAVNPAGTSLIHGISDRPVFAAIEAAAPAHARIGSLSSPTPSIKNGYPLPISAGGTNLGAYLAVGMFRPRNGWHARVDGALDFLVVTPLQNLPTLPTEREFYAVVMESGVLRPYELGVASIYFFHEFRSAGRTDIVRRQQWLAKVDEAITMRMRTRAESRERDNQADDEFLGDITPARLAHMKKVVSNLKKPKYTTAFKAPIDPVMLGIPNYPEIIKVPMDLSTLETKLKKKQYKTVKKFRSDFNLIVNNCYLFNGCDHHESKQAAKMQEYFDTQMSMIPSLSVVDPVTPLAKKTTEKAAIASEDSRATRVDSHPTEPAMERRVTPGAIKIEDDEITEAVFTDQSPSEKGAQLPTRKRRRIEPREQAGTNMVENKKRLEAFVAAEEQRSKTLLALINQAATPQTLQAMNDIYEHSFGKEHTRATAAFAQALQKVTTAIGTARKERASTLQEIADEVDELRDME